MPPVKSAKQRLDQLLVERGLAETRSRAQALVMSGNVFCGEARLDKPGQQVAGDIALTVRGPEHPWASTGGFTDVLLKAGAARVYAVDVGKGQLAWSLRQDERVVVLEGTNARSLTRQEIPEAPALIVCDASFIGLRTVLPAALALAGEGAHLVALIKPQFEVGKGRVGKGGVVRDAALHREVCDTIRGWLGGEMGWEVIGIVPSPITGPKGNIEFLIVAKRPQ